MIWLLKLLILGKVCAHEWREMYRFQPYSNWHKYVLRCTKCGKIKKITLKKIEWDF